MADWPTPAAALVISGEQVGYLEPCGCTAGQKGGLHRRHAFVELLKAQGWPVSLIDLGSLINAPDTRGGPQQAMIRFDTSIKALNLMGYEALALSAEDLRLGVTETLMRYGNLLGERLKLLSANVTPQPGLGLEEKMAPSRLIESGPVRVGITAVLTTDAYESLKDDAKDQLLTITPPDQVLRAVLENLEKSSDFQILMVQGEPEAAKRLAGAFPGFDIVIGTSPFADPNEEPEILNNGETWLVNVGKKGQYLGILGLYPDAQKRMRFRRLVLGPRFDEYTALAAPMKKLIGDDLQADLRSADVLGSYPKRPYAFNDMPSDATYVGAASCRECHPNTYAKWATTKHAHAYEPLENPKRNREADADCVRCHTTGFEYLSGFVSAELTPALKGNQCENCHGPGSKHIADPDNSEIRRSIARSAEDWDKNHRCAQCHDEDNDPAFKFADRYSQILHKGLDRYDQPKVHRPLETRVETTAESTKPTSK
jgi:hypothetical protein